MNINMERLVKGTMFEVCPPCEGTGDLHLADWDNPIKLSGIVTCSIKVETCKLCKGDGYCTREEAFEYALSGRISHG